MIDYKDDQDTYDPRIPPDKNVPVITQAHKCSFEEIMQELRQRYRTGHIEWDNDINHEKVEYRK